MAAPGQIWKGYLKLSLVSCAVALYPATTETTKIHFHKLNRKTGGGCDEKADEEVPSDEQARGYSSLSPRCDTGKLRGNRAAPACRAVALHHATSIVQDPSNGRAIRFKVKGLGAPLIRFIRSSLR